MVVGDFYQPLERHRRLARPVGGRLKRIFDVVVALIALVAFLPVLIVVGILVKLSGPGPVIYGHERVGCGDKSFRCLKFRSMVVDSAEVLRDLLENDATAREEWESTHKLRNDPRITRLGHILRISSLDELPQLVNDLRGEMSLIGPRPIVRAEARHYGEDMVYYHAARPGITGLWQVNGRSDVDYPSRVRFDIQYVTNWSMALDVKILLKTVVVVLSREGSR